MASKTYIQYYADGTKKKFLRKKQGRRESPKETLRTETIILHVTKDEKEKFLEMQRNSGFSQSLFGSIVLSTGIRQLFDSNNCSTQ